MDPHPHKQPTLRDIWSSILPRFNDKANSPAMPMWPPDVFALCAYALKQQSRYVRVVSEGWPAANEADRKTWLANLSKRAAQWLQTFTPTGGKLPPRIQKLWDGIVAALDEPLPADGDGSWAPALYLMELLSIADEACRYFHRKHPGADEAQSLFTMWIRAEGEKVLDRNDHISLCEEIPPSRLRVLLKGRTPQKGLTLRSLSLYACLLEGTEIDARLRSFTVEDDLTANLLIIPWPFTVHPSQLRAIDENGHAANSLPNEFRFFTFDIESVNARKFTAAVVKLIQEAEEDVGGIRFVILPELALREADAAGLAKRLASLGVNLICGVGMPATGDTFGRNYVLYDLGHGTVVRQHKHHRWKLDEPQIRQYSAGAQLPLGSEYWEHVGLSNRTISFIDVHPWLKVCALICEDLARPDPVGDIIRAVGPNLTVALLMDGPQLATRWPARHATILAEDPGSSVLTITSLGMSSLSKPTSGPDRSRVVALWKEASAGAVQEIEMPTDRDCVVLSLSMRKTKDWAADGRSRVAATPALTGVRYFKLPIS